MYRSCFSAALYLCLGLSLNSPLTARADDTIENIVITGSPVHRSGDDLTTAVTTITRSDILSSASTSLGDLLADEPGISQSSFAAGASRPIIRGLDNFRIRIQENGVASQDASALSEDHGVPIDPLAAQRIEVVRGPATLRYGTQAIGGVVNVINNRVPKSLPKNPVEAEGFASFNTVNAGGDMGLNLDARAGPRAAWHADGFYRKTGDYDIPRAPGSMINTATQALGYAAGSALIVDRGHAGISLARFESTYEIPAAEVPLFIEMDQTKANLDIEFDLSAPRIKTLRLESGISNYHHDEINAQTGITGSTFKTRDAEARLELLHTPVGPLAGALGLQWATRDLSATGEGGELIAPATTTSAALFIFEEWEWTDHVDFQVAARAETIAVDGFGLASPATSGLEHAWSRNFIPLGASFGTTFKFNDTLVMTLTSQIVQRAPEALELFAKGPHEATETFELGNPLLDMETALSTEISLQQSTSPLTWKVTAFHTRFQDFIYKAFTGLSCGEDLASCGIEDELTQVAYAQDDARFFGFEAQSEWQAGQIYGGSLRLNAWGDYVRGTLEQNGNAPRMPPARLGLGAEYGREPWFGALKLTRTLKQDQLAEFETATRGHTNLVAELGLHLPFGRYSKGMIVKLTGHNLLDEDMRNHVSFKKEDVPLPGRAVRLVLSGSF